MAQPLRLVSRILEETIVKNVLLAGSMLVGLANAASAQITEIHSCYGPSGSHFVLGPETQTFNYQATISGATVAYVATLDVYLNGNLQTTSSQVVVAPPPSYLFSAPVNMASWGLRPGDAVTFRLRVVRLGSYGGLLAAHSLTGDVVAVKSESGTE